MIKSTKNVNQNTLIVAITAYEQTFQLSQQFDDTLSKPITKDMVLKILMAVASHRPTAEPPARVEQRPEHGRTPPRVEQRIDHGRTESVGSERGSIEGDRTVELPPLVPVKQEVNPLSGSPVPVPSSPLAKKSENTHSLGLESVSLGLLVITDGCVY